MAVEALALRWLVGFIRVNGALAVGQDDDGAGDGREGGERGKVDENEESNFTTADTANSEIPERRKLFLAELVEFLDGRLCPVVAFLGGIGGEGG